jgi:hypothetical protein
VCVRVCLRVCEREIERGREKERERERERESKNIAEGGENKGIRDIGMPHRQPRPDSLCIWHNGTSGCDDARHGSSGDAAATLHGATAPEARQPRGASARQRGAASGRRGLRRDAAEIVPDAHPRRREAVHEAILQASDTAEPLCNNKAVSCHVMSCHVMSCHVMSSHAAMQRQCKRCGNATVPGSCTGPSQRGRPRQTSRMGPCCT